MYHHHHNHHGSAYTPSPSHHRRRSLTPGRVAGELVRAVERERDRNFLSPEDALLRRPRALSHSAYSPHRHPESVLPLAARTPTPRHYPSYMARAPHYAPPPPPVAMAMPPQPAPAVQLVQVPVPVPVPVPAAPHGLHGQFPASMPADVYGQGMGMGMGYPGAGGRRPMIRRSSSWAHLARDAQRLGREYEYAHGHGHGHHHPHAGYGGVGIPFER